MLDSTSWSLRRLKFSALSTVGVTVVGVIAGGCVGLGQGTAGTSGEVATDVSIVGAPSSDDVADAASILRGVSGVSGVAADMRRAELRIWSQRELPFGPIVSRALVPGTLFSLRPGGGSYAIPDGYPADADVRWVTRSGRDVRDLGVHTAEGKVTLFLFSADWCEACRLLDREVQVLVAESPAVAVRKLDIVSGDSALASRWIHSDIPLSIIVGRRGRELGRVVGCDTETVRSIVTAAAAND